MEDNLSHAIEMSAAVLLFIFALSSAIFSYNRLSDTALNLITFNIESRRGTSANDRLKSEDDILRKTDYAEIVLSALNLPKTVMTNGNSGYSNYDYKIVVNRKGENAYTYEIKANSPENELYMGNNKYVKDFVSSITISANGASYIFIFDKYVMVRDSRGEDIEVTADLFKSNSEDIFLTYAKNFFSASATYNVRYTEDAIIYDEI